MKYVGRYSCTDLPGTVIVTKDSLGLLAMPEGAAAYRLTPERRKKFRCSALHMLLDFDAKGRGFILQQEKNKYVFVRAS